MECFQIRDITFTDLLKNNPINVYVDNCLRPSQGGGGEYSLVP